MVGLAALAPPRATVRCELAAEDPRQGGSPARAHPEDGEKIRTGRICVAPPDHHLLIDDGTIAVKKGPKENRFRPSIDAHFRSAAYIYGPRAIGVVLSGVLDDGTSGLWSIKRLGGIAIVQQPDEARFESMPRSALEHVSVDHTMPSSRIGKLLAQPVETPPASNAEPDPIIAKRMAQEVGDLTPFTCPECHGVLVRIVEGNSSRFRCHTGHAYTDSALLEGVVAASGEVLWQVIRSMEEPAMALSHMGRDLERGGDAARAVPFFAKARELEKRSRTFLADALEHQALSGENIGQEAEE